MLFVVVFHISEILSEPLVGQGIDHQYICFFYTVCQQHNTPPSPVQHSTRNSFHRNDPFLLKLPFPHQGSCERARLDYGWRGAAVIVRKCAHLYSYLFLICISLFIFGWDLVHCCPLSLWYLDAETGYRVATPYTRVLEI